MLLLWFRRPMDHVEVDEVRAQPRELLLDYALDALSLPGKLGRDMPPVAPPLQNSPSTTSNRHRPWQCRQNCSRAPHRVRAIEDSGFDCAVGITADPPGSKSDFGHFHAGLRQSPEVSCGVPRPVPSGYKHSDRCGRICIASPSPTANRCRAAHHRSSRYAHSRVIRALIPRIDRRTF